MIRNIRVDTMKLKNKNYKQAHKVSEVQIKQNSKRSFESMIGDSHDYDEYINKIYQKMLQEQVTNSILVIPKTFKRFIESKLFKELLKKIFEYMLMLEQYETHYSKFAAEHQLQSGSLMINEAQELQQKFKEVSYVYMGVLLSHAEAKFIFRDQYFFQTMIYFISEMLKESFEEEIYPVIDSELNRFFRTNTFNLIKRRYQEDRVVRQYPQLKDKKYCSTQKCDQQLITRLKAHKRFHYAMQIKMKEPMTVTKPLDIFQSASKSINSRSPLIASYFPSERERLFNFSRQSSNRDRIVTSIIRTRSSSFRN